MTSQSDLSPPTPGRRAFLAGSAAAYGMISNGIAQAADAAPVVHSFGLTNWKTNGTSPGFARPEALADRFASSSDSDASDHRGLLADGRRLRVLGGVAWRGLSFTDTFFLGTAA